MIFSPDNPIANALELLREKGWIRHVSQDREGRMCMVGALVSAKFYYAQRVKYINPVLSELYPDINPIPNGVAIIPFVNDLVVQDFAEVETIFEKAALKWEEDHATGA